MKVLFFSTMLLSLMGGMGYGLLAPGPVSRGAGTAPPTARLEDVVAANGIAEGAAQELAVFPEISGCVGRVLVRDNEDVARGALLVELRNDTQQAQLSLARAEAALAGVQCRQAQSEWQRTQKLGSATLSRERFDADHSKFQQAQAHLEQAEARVRLAEAELARTRLTAPFAGRVLQVIARPGQLVGPAGTEPVLILADLSRRRVRAFVDEWDALRLGKGQRAVVSADSLPGREFNGQVAEVLFRMGKDAPHSNAPGEYKDVYYRTVLIDLPQGSDLPVNYRVQVRIHPEPEAVP
jgi:RND family efflux transporter MFP subunit